MTVWNNHDPAHYSFRCGHMCLIKKGAKEYVCKCASQFKLVNGHDCIPEIDQVNLPTLPPETATFTGEQFSMDSDYENATSDSIPEIDRVDLPTLPQETTTFTGEQFSMDLDYETTTAATEQLSMDSDYETTASVTSTTTTTTTPTTIQSNYAFETYCKPDKWFLCNDGLHCVTKQWRCDGEPDCFDDSDELNCQIENDELKVKVPKGTTVTTAAPTTTSTTVASTPATDFMTTNSFLQEGSKNPSINK